MTDTERASTASHRQTLRSGFSRVAPVLALMALAGCAGGPPPEQAATPAAPTTPQGQAEKAALPLPPEPPSQIVAKEAVEREHAMVVAANPFAAQAGREILEAGGTAVDAAIAVQAVLGLVEPQSSGIGGGAFLLNWNAKDRQITSWDGRETAPMAATPALFLKADGTPMSFTDAMIGGRSVGAPGVLKMLAAVHAREGALPWKALFKPAITLAEAGFPISERLHASLVAAKDTLGKDPVTRAYFYDAHGEPLAVGTVRRNPAYAATLSEIADKGADAFYTGKIAQDVVNAVHGHKTNPGLLSLADLKGYKAIARPTICTPWKGYSVCGMGLPSSGGVTVSQILRLTERFDTSKLPATGSETAHLLAEAGRLAFADRNLYLGDSDFVSVPVEGLLAADYLKGRSALIDPLKAMPDAEPGTPANAPKVAEGPTGAQPSTSQISIVDAKGNAVSMTTSVEHSFGSRVMVDGFLLNNQLTDFAFAPEVNGKPVANRVQPGKRPLSSMSPTMVFDKAGKLVLVLGSPGGSQIIGYVAQTIVAILDQKLDPQTAVSLPHVLNRDRAETEVETEALKTALEARGHKVKVAPMTSGLGVIEITARPTKVEDKDPADAEAKPADAKAAEGSKEAPAPLAAKPGVKAPAMTTVLIGGADPRREGVAVGY